MSANLLKLAIVIGEFFWRYCEDILKVLYIQTAGFMNQNPKLTDIENLFCQFITEKSSIDKDIEYCLKQSTVEPTIRFKFGAWLNNYFNDNPDRMTLNLMEANRLDLVIGIDDQIYFIEFGHLLNILKHKADLNKGKVEWDSKNIIQKADKLITKIKKIDSTLLNGKKINYSICSLFSDFKIEERENRFHTILNTNQLKTGTLFKYGNNFRKSNYFNDYQSFLNNTEESEYLFGYTEAVIIPDKLSLHYKFESVNL